MIITDPNQMTLEELMVIHTRLNKSFLIEDGRITQVECIGASVLEKGNN